MWSAGSDRVAVYLGERHASWCFTATPERVHVIRDLAPDAALKVCLRDAREAGAHRKLRKPIVDVHLSGSLARPFLFESMEGVQTRAEALDIAASLAADRTALTGPCVVWLDEAWPSAAVVGVAVETSLRDSIEQTAKELGWRLASLKPWWSVAIESAEAAVQLLVIDEPDSMTVFAEQEGVTTRLSTHAPINDVDRKLAFIRRVEAAASKEAVRIAHPQLQSPGALA